MSSFGAAYTFMVVFIATAFLDGNKIKWLDMYFRISLNVLFATLAFVALRQYLKVNALVLEAENRLAMAKMLARIQSKETNQETKDYAMPKIVDAICYRLNSKPVAVDAAEIIR